ncbi:MAG: glycosyltransferase family 2 protein [Phycisphaerales bacterium]
MHRISVVIPTFNRAAMVLAAIDSVRAQPTPVHEIIIVDDGSTDDTLARLAGLGPAIRIIAQPNAGPGPARNAGLAAATGDYVAFLDSDDRWLPWTHDTFQRAIASTPAGAAVVCGSPRAFEDDSEIASITREADLFEPHADYLGTDPIDLFPGAGVLCASAEALRRVGGFPLQRMTAEDADLYLRLGIEPGFVVIRRPYTLAYRIHPGATSLDGALDEAGAHALLQRERDGLYPGGPARRWERERIISSHCRSRTMVAVRAGRLAAAARIYAASAAMNARQRRYKFLLALPALALARVFGYGAGPLHTGVVRQRAAAAAHQPH